MPRGEIGGRAWNGQSKRDITRCLPSHKETGSHLHVEDVVILHFDKES